MDNKLHLIEIEAIENSGFAVLEFDTGETMQIEFDYDIETEFEWRFCEYTGRDLEIPFPVYVVNDKTADAVLYSDGGAPIDTVDNFGPDYWSESALLIIEKRLNA